MPKHSRSARRGIIAPLTAILLIVLFGMVAFAIDTIWMVTTKSELQNAADSAALAGAQELYKNYTLYNLANQTAANKTELVTQAVANARSTAKAYAAANGAGGVTSLTLLDSDIEIGYTDGAGKFTVYATGGKYPNTVKVLDRRDSSANQSLRLFFGAVFGKSSVDLTAQATATLYTGSVSSFKSSGSSNVSILPFTYDADHWSDFLASSKDPDGNLSTDSDGNPQLQIYPSIKYKGNFGQLSLSNSNVGTSTMRNWLTEGLNPSEIAKLVDDKLLPLENHDATKWDWQGSTGFSASLVMDTNDLAGTTAWLPLFKAYNSSSSDYQAGTGKGNYYHYNIVAFVPVTIIEAPDTNRQVIVRPAEYTDAFATFNANSIVPAGTATSSSTSFPVLMAPRLSN